MTEHARFTRITAVSVAGRVIVYALDENGVVWKQEDGRSRWTPLPVERSEA